MTDSGFAINDDMAEQLARQTTDTNTQAEFDAGRQQQSEPMFQEVDQ